MSIPAPHSLLGPPSSGRLPTRSLKDSVSGLEGTCGVAAEVFAACLDLLFFALQCGQKVFIFSGKMSRAREEAGFREVRWKEWSHLELSLPPPSPSPSPRGKSTPLAGCGYRLRRLLPLSPQPLRKTLQQKKKVSCLLHTPKRSLQPLFLSNWLPW